MPPSRNWKDSTRSSKIEIQSNPISRETERGEGGGIEGLSPGTKQTVRNNEVSAKRASTVGIHHVLGLEYFELWVMLELLAIAGFACRAVS